MFGQVAKKLLTTRSTAVMPKRGIVPIPGNPKVQLKGWQVVFGYGFIFAGMLGPSGWILCHLDGKIPYLCPIVLSFLQRIK